MKRRANWKAFAGVLLAASIAAPVSGQEYATEETMRAQRLTLERLQRVAPAMEARWDANRGTIFLRGNLSPPGDGVPRARALDFLTDNDIPFVLDRPEADLRFEETTTDDLGWHHVTFTQAYRGIPVWSKQVKVHINPANEVVAVNGQYMPLDVPLVMEIAVTGEQALDAALTHAEGRAREVPAAGPELVIFERRNEFFVAWTMTLRGQTFDGGEALWVYFVDANSGGVIFRFNNLQTDATIGTGLDCKNGDLSLNVFFDTDSGVFQLRDVTRTDGDGGEIHTLDGDNALSTDDDGIWDDTTTSPRTESQQPEASVHFWLGRSYDLLLDLTGRESYDDAGSNVIAKTHVEVGGSANNASWNGVDLELKFGDGDGDESTYFGCANDVVAHEFMHAVTQFTANLVYADESGAMNEAYSDIFGAMVDAGDWLHAEDKVVPPLLPTDRYRDMQDPTKGGLYDPDDGVSELVDKGVPQPDHYNDRFTGDENNGGVHINSGIVNKAFYLIADGFEVDTASGYACNLGIGRNRAWAAFYHALENFLTPGASFFELEATLVTASGAVFPHRAFIPALVDDVFAAVGVSGSAGGVVCPQPSIWLLH